jgi:hypothetical protein
VLPVDIPQPQRNLGLLRLAGPPSNPAAIAFGTYVEAAFETMKQLITRHENAVVWRR